MKAVISLSLLLIIVGQPVKAQTYNALPSTIHSGSTYPMIFDDFQFRAQPDHAGQGLSGPGGSVFGRNGWLTGAPTGVPTVDSTRMWYANGHWLEWFGQFEPWFENDGDGYFLESQLGGGGTPSTLTLGADGYIVRDVNGASTGGWPSIRSGFSRRTGTWITRMRLPGFEGLRHHNPSGDGSDTDMVPAFWTQSYYAVEDRQQYTLGDAPGGLISWFEWNFEINNWVSPAYVPNATTQPTAPMSIGLMWGMGGLYGEPSNWEEYSENPLPGESEPQHCYIAPEPGTTAGAYYGEPEECFDIMVGEAGLTREDLPWHPYVYLMATITETTSQFFFIVIDEDEIGAPGDEVKNFQMLYLSTPVFNNYVTPEPMSTFFSLGMGCYIEDDPMTMGTEPGCYLDEERRLEIDWFLYTPEDDRDIWGLLGDVGSIRYYLDHAISTGSGSAPTPYRRINTVTYPNTSTNVRLNSAYATRSGLDSCQAWLSASEALRPTLPYDFHVEARRTDNKDYLLAVQDESATVGLHHATMRMTWDVTGWYDESNWPPWRPGAGGGEPEAGLGRAAPPVTQGSGQQDLLDPDPYHYATLEDLGFGIILTPSHLGYYADIEVTMERVWQPGWSPSTQDAPFVRTPAVCSDPTGVTSVTRHYRYYPTGGTIVETFPSRPAGSASTADTYVLRLAPVTPNPSRAGLRLSFEVPGVGYEQPDVRMAVYDMLGREVSLLVDQPMPAGPQTLQWEAEGLSPGVYTVVLEAGHQRVTQRITRLR